MVGFTMAGGGPVLVTVVEGNHGGANPALAVNRRSKYVFSVLMSHPQMPL
jgi:hypothetical protein